MFYADFVLSRKGPLARIWLAAHWDKRLTKAQIFETNVESSIDKILRPKVKLALRTSGHLMLGVVRIYSMKTKYLLEDCTVIFDSMKTVFRPYSSLDLPEDQKATNLNMLNPFPDIDIGLLELNNIDLEAQFILNQSNVNDITIAEDYESTSVNIENDEFCNTGFEANRDSDVSRCATSRDTCGIFEEIGVGAFEKHDGRPSVMNVNFASCTALERNSDLGVVIEDVANSSLDQIQPEVPSISGLHQNEQLNDNVDNLVSPSPEGLSINEFQPSSPVLKRITRGDAAVASTSEDHNEQPNVQNNAQSAVIGMNQKLGGIENQGKQTDQTTLVQNEEESFALAPVDASALRGHMKSKRKRKLVVDQVKCISGDDMKARLDDTSDIVTTLDLAPPTKQLMSWQQTGSVAKLFSFPGQCIRSTTLFMNYQRHLIVKPISNKEFEDRAHLDETREENKVGIDTLCSPPSRSGRKPKRKFPDIESQSEHEEGQKRLHMVHQNLPIISEEPAPNFFFEDTHLDQPAAEPTPTTPSETTVAPLFATIPQPSPVSATTPTTSEAYIELSPILTVGLQEENIDGCNFTTDRNSILLNEGQEQEDQEDKRGDNETTKQFEERVLNKRAAHLIRATRERIITGSETTFDDLIRGDSRKQLAQKFFSLLVLKKYEVLELTQEEPYSSILLTKGPKFDHSELFS